MKRLIILTLLAYASINVALAQNYSLQLLSYKWDKAIEYTPDSSAKAHPTTFVLMRKINEYLFNPKTNNLEAYYCTHTIKYINDNKSIEDNNKVYVPVGSTQNIVEIRTRIINKGKVVFQADANDFIQIEEEGNKYNIIALKGLEQGMLVETYTVTKVVNFDLYDNEYFQTESPIKKAEFYLITPGNLEFRCKGYNGFPAITDSLVEERHIYYGVDSNIIEIDKDEKYSLENANKKRVEFNFYKNTYNNKFNAKWPEIGRIFFDRIHYNYDKNVKDLDKVIKKINIAAAKSEEEKYFIVENYLKTNITVDQNVEDEEGFASSFKKRASTQYRFNQIMAQLYRRMELPLEVVLTCEKDYKRFDADFDSWSFLRSVVFYVPSLKKFIDPESATYRIGKINNNFLGQDGLFVKFVTIGDAVSASASIKNIPGNDVKLNQDIENYTISLTPDLSKVKFVYNRMMNGYAEQGLKSAYFYLNDEKRKEVFEGFIKGLAKNATLTNLSVKNYDHTQFQEINLPLQIDANLETDYYIEPVGDNLLLKIGEVIGQQSEMYQEKPRTNKVDIEFAHAYNRTITFEIPDGYKLKGLEKLNLKLEFNNADGKPSYGFVSSYKLEGNKLIITCTEYYNDLTYQVKEFENFKKVINAAADFNKITILLEKK
ncbi:MAG: DUF3857 domain-containing protein [Bacteroidia bacterium]|jgi:hypothetical protein|nr:DUF3857 domain-containing protein [Bacteroidia bacterium]